MAIRAQNIDWIATAWKLSDVLAELPDYPRMGTLLDPEFGPMPQLQNHQRALIDVIRVQIALHLTYRIYSTHKVRYPSDPGLLFHADYLEPEQARRAYEVMTLSGVNFDSAETHAISAQLMLTHILADRFACPEWKRVVPLHVASISGKSTSLTAQANGAQPRERPASELQKALADELKRDRYQTWKQLLQNLEHDGPVLEWTESEIHWVNQDGKTEVTKVSTFLGWRTALILE